MAIVDVKSFEQLKQEVGEQLSLASPIDEH